MNTSSKRGMKTKLETSRLLRRIHYQFNDISLFDRALSHRSVGKDNNERLEFLGDSLLNFIIAEALFDKFPLAKEGELSRLRALLVQGETLAELAREFELGENLILGEGEMKSGGARRNSILADALEAIIGAIYVDGGFVACQRTVLAWFAERLNDISIRDTIKDPKTRLQEFLQEQKRSLPVYTVIDTQGEAHAKEFVVECRLRDFNKVSTASASSKRTAEKLAAEKMLDFLGLWKSLDKS